MSFPLIILTLWIGLTAATVLLTAGLIAWGIRTRQFSDQNRARYLPLGEPPPEVSTEGMSSGVSERKPRENSHA